MTLLPTSTMAEVMESFPGARRALFSRYHIGGCSSCGFSMQETLEKLCARNGGLPVDEVIGHIQQSHEHDLRLMVTPADLHAHLSAGAPCRLIDIRSREEHEAVALPGSQLMTEEVVQDLMNRHPRDGMVVFYDHRGQHALDAASYFEGHGFSGARALAGGIDRWACEVDPNMPRYEIES
jgi:rhodanese-related sulfurtransferase